MYGVSGCRGFDSGVTIYVPESLLSEGESHFETLNKAVAIMMTVDFIGACKQNTRMSTSFVADMFSSLPISFDPAMVRSAQDYVLLEQVLRMPIQVSKDGQVEGDLLKSWTVEDGYKTYSLVMKENLFWSDNKPILARDLVNSIQRQMRLKSAVHFDFSQIQKIQMEDDYRVRVYLKEPNTRFLNQLAYPEFGLVRNYQKDLLKSEDLKISSGPYSVESFFPDRSITLIKNAYYEHFQASPEKVVIQSSSVEEQLEGLKSGTIDFVVPSRSVSQQEFFNVNENSDLRVYDPHFGFTFWISINGKSKLMSSRQNRKYIQSVLSDIDIDFSKLSPFWQSAKQLYLPGEMGRPSIEDVSKIWQNTRKAPVQEIPKLSLLVSKRFLFLPELEKALVNKNIALEIVFYNDLNEFTNAQNEAEFDLVQINNDFSSVDVSDSVLVTFNNNRPLVFVGADQDKYSSLISTIVSSHSSEAIHSATRDIGVELLEDGYIFPVAYYITYFYIRKSIDISEWSQIFPDIKFWKVSANR